MHVCQQSCFNYIVTNNSTRVALKRNLITPRSLAVKAGVFHITSGWVTRQGQTRLLDEASVQSEHITKTNWSGLKALEKAHVSALFQHVRILFEVFVCLLYQPDLNSNARIQYVWQSTMSFTPPPERTGFSENKNKNKCLIYNQLI